MVRKMVKWKSDVLPRMTARLLKTHNLKQIGDISENGVVATILESLKNKRKFIFIARRRMYYPKGDVVSGMNKKAVDESVKKNWNLLIGFEKEDLVYELDATTIARIYKNNTIYFHNQIIIFRS